MPSRIASLGSGRGGICEVRNRFNTLIISSLTGSSTTQRDQPQSPALGTVPRRVRQKAGDADAPVATAISPR